MHARMLLCWAKAGLQVVVSIHRITLTATASMSIHYAVRSGYQPGVYLDVQDAREQVLGFSYGDFRKFWTYQEALNYLDHDIDVDAQFLLVRMRCSSLGCVTLECSCFPQMCCPHSNLMELLGHKVSNLPEVQALCCTNGAISWRG